MSDKNGEINTLSARDITGSVYLSKGILDTSDTVAYINNSLYLQYIYFLPINVRP